MTNVIEVRGGNARERKIVEDVSSWCVRELLPKFRTLDIKIEMTNCMKDGAYGYALDSNDRNVFELEIARGLKLFDLITTVCHEMVHVKQYARKELTCVGVQSRWKGEAVGSRVQYHNLPWEKEAFKLQDVIAVKCLKDIYSDEY